MFVGCSETSVSVIVKHVQHVVIIIRAFCLPEGTCYVFQCLRDRNITGLWLAREGIST